MCQNCERADASVAAQPCSHTLCAECAAGGCYPCQVNRRAGVNDGRYSCPKCSRAPWEFSSRMEMIRGRGRLIPRDYYECGNGHRWMPPDLSDAEMAEYKAWQEEWRAQGWEYDSMTRIATGTITITVKS